MKLVPDSTVDSAQDADPRSETRRTATSSPESRTKPTRAGVLTIGLAVSAALILTYVRSQATGHPTFLLASAFSMITFAVALAFARHGLAGAARTLDQWFPGALIIWSLLPLGLEYISRLFGIGESFEFTMLACLQNASLWYAIHSNSATDTHARLSVLLGSFLVIFVVAVSDTWLALVLALIYGAVFAWWLMVAYWARIHRYELTATKKSYLPLRMAIMLLAAAIALPLVWSLNSNHQVLSSWTGVSPVSGGQDDFDAFAQSGVGNGDAVVAAKDEAQSFGAVESDLFLESHQPSLYDMFSDLYGDPPRPNKKFQRAVALAGTSQKQEQHLAQSQKAGRDFATVRQSKPRSRDDFKDKSTSAMLLVKGRSPLHLADQYYDSFDGVKWAEETQPHAPQPLIMTEELGHPWVYLMPRQTANWKRGTQSHVLKIVNLKSERIPSPPHLEKVHIDKVADKAFYGWTADGAFRMNDRDSVPSLTVIHVRSRRVNLNPFREVDFTRKKKVNVDESAEVGVPKGCEQAIGLAKKWTLGIPRGWLQVEEICRRLKLHCRLDSESLPPENCANSIAWFLESKAGPDYLFATTAAMMLRGIGYETRMATGFYVHPRDYDPTSGYSVVGKESAHAWIEVCVDGDHWVTAEPTPGFKADYESLSLWQHARRLAFAIFYWVKRNFIGLCAFGLVAVVLYCVRRRVFDVALQIWFAITFRGSPQNVIFATLRLIERRARLWGVPRPASQPLGMWLRQSVGARKSNEGESSDKLLAIIDRALYAPGLLSIDQEIDLRKECRTMLRQFGSTLRSSNQRRNRKQV